MNFGVLTSGAQLREFLLYFESLSSHKNKEVESKNNQPLGGGAVVNS